MHTDIIIRKKTARICTILSVCALGFYTTACDSGEVPGKEKDPSKTELRFTASISDSPSTKTINGSDITEGSIFPDDTHTFGMFITREGGDELVAGSGDNMKLTLTKSGSTETWSQTDKNDVPLSLIAKHGESIHLTGYYPWTADAGVSATSIPFDLSGDMSTCTDLLYLSSPAGTQQVYDAPPIALNFSHAYCWVTVNLSKLTNKNEVIVKSVSIENSVGNLKRVINRGTINPKTGDVINGTSGPLVINCNPTIHLPSNDPNNPVAPATFNFLVPSFMRTDVQDSEIVIRITTETSSGTTEVLSFPFNKEHLNNAGDKYGFEKGKHNTYNIVYNNSEMILSLSDWQGVWIGDSKFGEGTAGVTPIEMPYKHNGIAPLDQLKKIAMGNHINHTYLGEVAENNNGKYVTIESTGTLFDIWRPFVTTEPFYPSLKVSRNEAVGGSPVPWKDEETGILMAKQACAEFREGGYTDWRLPRISEFFMFVYVAPIDLRLSKSEYWSATEYNADESYCLTSSRPPGVTANWAPQHISKTANIYVRCVRDSDKPKPTI